MCFAPRFACVCVFFLPCASLINRIALYVCCAIRRLVSLLSVHLLNTLSDLTINRTTCRAVFFFFRKKTVDIIIMFSHLSMAIRLLPQSENKRAPNWRVCFETQIKTCACGCCIRLDVTHISWSPLPLRHVVIIFVRTNRRRRRLRRCCYSCLSSRRR